MGLKVFVAVVVLGVLNCFICFLSQIILLFNANVRSIYRCLYPSEKQVVALPAAWCSALVAQSEMSVRFSHCEFGLVINIKYLITSSLCSLPPSPTQVDKYLNVLFLFPNQYFSKSIECWNVLQESGNVGNSEFFSFKWVTLTP